MNDERADLILNMLRAIRAEQAAQREKLDEIISRIGALEREVATLTLRFAEMKVDFANLSVRIDNLDHRLSRVEQRLELVEVPAPMLFDRGAISDRLSNAAWRLRPRLGRRPSARLPGFPHSSKMVHRSLANRSGTGRRRARLRGAARRWRRGRCGRRGRADRSGG